MNCTLVCRYKDNLFDSFHGGAVAPIKGCFTPWHIPFVVRQGEAQWLLEFPAIIVIKYSCDVGASRLNIRRKNFDQGTILVQQEFGKISFDDRLFHAKLLC